MAEVLRMCFFPSVWLSLFLVFGTTAFASSPVCMGPENARKALVYLHGLEAPRKKSAEEAANREVLERLARELSIRIALPQAPRTCAHGKLCWPGANRDEVRSSFRVILQSLEACKAKARPFALLGFSNGGYYAFKLWKVEHEPLLQLVIASGSAGQWQPGVDQVHPHAPFHLMIGKRELTYQKAQQLAKELRKSLPGFKLDAFDGGHRLDFSTLQALLKRHGF